MEINEINKNIANNLRFLRESKKLTQLEVIEFIGEENISLRTYKSYESGKYNRTPSLDKLSILADFYAVSIDFLIFNKPSTYDNSYTKKDNLKRLARLIYSLTLQPVKEINPDSKMYGKYYFISYDKDVSVFLNKYESKCELMNNEFEYKDNNIFKGIQDFDDVINEIDELDDNWEPTLNRHSMLLLESGIDPQEFHKNHMSRINKRRKIQSIKDGK